MTNGTSPIRRIVVPHDFSETADCALSLALGLAQALGASVTVMHAYELPTYGYSFPDGPGVTVELAGQIERAARVALEGVATRSRKSGVRVDAVLRRGLASNEIDALAKEIEADLVVIGTHGRRGFARLLLGSVAERVVRTAPCPVLTVRGPADAK